MSHTCGSICKFSDNLIQIIGSAQLQNLLMFSHQIDDSWDCWRWWWSRAPSSIISIHLFWCVWVPWHNLQHCELHLTCCHTGMPITPINNDIVQFGHGQTNGTTVAPCSRKGFGIRSAGRNGLEHCHSMWMAKKKRVTNIKFADLFQTIQWPFSWCCVVAQPISKLTTSVFCSGMAQFGILATWPCSETGNQT